jgi:hypothetical protein
MAPREPFTHTVPGLVCPLCLCGHYTLIAGQDRRRGLLQNIYLCGGCKSFFGDSRQFDGSPGDAGKPPA